MPATCWQEERNDERRQREQTEGQLRVLAQAIGGIVHDLGNPLTSVQMGAETCWRCRLNAVPTGRRSGK